MLWTICQPRGQAGRATARDEQKQIVTAMRIASHVNGCVALHRDLVTTNPCSRAARTRPAPRARREFLLGGFMAAT